MILQIKTLKIKCFLPLNFAIIKICVAIRLAEDRTRMGGLYFRLSPSKTVDNKVIEFPRLLKKLRNRFLCIICFLVIILFSTGLHKSAFSTYTFGKLAFLLSVFSASMFRL